MSESEQDALWKEALQRIARTPDGKEFRRALQRSLVALAPSPESGALQVFEGGRRYAHQILAVMDSAITENDASGRPDADTIPIARPGAVSTRARSGARRRVTAESGTST